MVLCPLSFYTRFLAYLPKLVHPPASFPIFWKSYYILGLRGWLWLVVQLKVLFLFSLLKDGKAFISVGEHLTFMIAYCPFPTSSAERICDKSSFFYHRFVFLHPAELELTNNRLGGLGNFFFHWPKLLGLWNEYCIPLSVYSTRECSSNSTQSA